jgi:hypothetical protein
MRLVATPIPSGSFLVRFHPDDGPHYDRMIVVTPEDGGRTLHLFGWIANGKQSHKDWLAAKDALFPDAVRVRFERLKPDGTLSHRTLPLP